MATTAFSALVIMAIGLILRRWGVVGRRDAQALVRIVIAVAMPALVFQILMRAELHGSLVLVPVVGLVLHAVLVGISLVLGRAMRLDRPGTGALVVASAVGNTGFFGVPLIAASGAGFSPLAALMYDTFATAVITWTSTVAVSSAFGQAGEGGVRWRTVGRSLLVPPNFAIALGLALNLSGVRESDLPGAVTRPLDILSAAVLPLVMLYVGVVLAPRALPRVWRQVAVVAAVRLGLAGALGYLLARSLELHGDVLRTTVVMSAMPTAIMSLVIGGGRYRLNADLIAGAILVTTVLCTATLPLVRGLVS